jgi:antibiotic biosynthesis monooxygenase (ABM) superfamily enzyme
MIRFLLSVILLTLLITYAIIPFVKYIAGFFKKEVKRIDKSLNTKNDEENEK